MDMNGVLCDPPSKQALESKNSMAHEDDEYLKGSKGRRYKKTDEQRREDHRARMAHERPKKPRYERTPEVFAANLNGLTALTGKTAREVADDIGVQWRWYRRILGQGLARIYKDFRPSLERIADYFRLGDSLAPIEGRVEELWNPKLDALKRSPPKPAILESWRQKCDWPHAQKLLELLEGGQHDYLRGLIDSLHRLACQEGLKTQGEAAYTADPDPADPSELKARRRRSG